MYLILLIWNLCRIMTISKQLSMLGKVAWKVEMASQMYLQAKKYFRENLQIQSPRKSQIILPTKIMAEKKKISIKKIFMLAIDILKPLRQTRYSILLVMVSPTQNFQYLTVWLKYMVTVPNECFVLPVM